MYKRKYSFMQLLKLPEKDISNLSTALRDLANRIDAGEYEGAEQIAFIIDCGEFARFGMLGGCDSVAEFNLLLDIAKTSLLANV